MHRPPRSRPSALGPAVRIRERKACVLGACDAESGTGLSAFPRHSPLLRSWLVRCKTHRMRKAFGSVFVTTLLLVASAVSPGCGATDIRSHGDAGTPTYAICSGPGECLALVPGCCGTCGAPTLADVVGVNSEALDDLKAQTCTDPHPTCPKCAQGIEPNLVAFCESKRCTALDIRLDTVSACDKDDDCILRYPECCERCSPDPFNLVAIAKAEAAHYQAEICKPSQACPACVPAYPAEFKAACGPDKHCKVVEKTNVCPADQPTADTVCHVDATVTCEYGDDIRPGCRTHATCPSGAWKIAVSGCPPLPGPGKDGCPATPPADGTCSNDGLVCDMGSDEVCACSDCAGPCSTVPRWACAGPPPTPGCPSRAPALGSACTDEALVCIYGVQCIAPVAAGRRCKDGAWVDEPLACPV